MKTNAAREIKIFAALEEDVHQGWVWIEDSSLPARSVIKISNQLTGKSIYCEALQIDNNFLSKYNNKPSIRHAIEENHKALVINAWYRAGLGIIKTKTDVSLKISACNSWRGQFMACTGHPQIIVRLAAWLGGISFVMGIIGLILGIISIWPTKS